MHLPLATRRSFEGTDEALIRYRFATGTADAWHAEVGVAADGEVTVTPLTIVAETTLHV